ncbi:hypothetical protein PIB30_067888 [Stylosanthes scabra]|uniref:Uncharacterized protein n=1 Tax=Stylosanthes scabra TaxID=79078 RepID=A0ABU6SN37_9FABA|nr:hypothetical protein [Stylosanthes scabra]
MITLLTFYYMIRSGALAGGSPGIRKDFGHQVCNDDREWIKSDEPDEHRRADLQSNQRMSTENPLSDAPADRIRPLQFSDWITDFIADIGSYPILAQPYTKVY